MNNTRAFLFPSIEKFNGTKRIRTIEDDKFNPRNTLQETMIYTLMGRKKEIKQIL